MVPATSERNLTPSSTALGSAPSPMAGTGLDGQIIAIEGLPAPTVSPVLPLTAPSVAEIVVVPGATAVATQSALIVAATVFEDAHVTWLVRFFVLPSE